MTGMRVSTSCAISNAGFRSGTLPVHIASWAWIALLFLVLVSGEPSFAKKFIVTSDPPEAQVQIDGKIVGTTPLSLDVHGSEIRAAAGLSWTDPAVIAISRSGCATSKMTVNRVLLEPKELHVRLDCYGPHMQAGYQFLLCERFADSVREYELALQLSPHEFEGAYNLALAYMRLAKYEDAKRAIGMALQINGQVPDLYSLRGLACSHLLQHEDAISSFEEALRLKPDSPETYFNLAQQFQLVGRLNEALASIDRSIQMRPDFIDAHILQARILEEQGHIAEAVEKARLAADLKPGSAEAKLVLGWELIEYRHPEEALASIQSAIQLRPDIPKGQSYLCRADDEVGKYADAISVCGIALARDPADPEALQYLAIAYERTGMIENASKRYHEAAEAFEKIPELDAYGSYLAGNAHFRLGQFQRAIENYERTVQLRPTFASARLNLGLAYVHVRNEDAAEHQYDFLQKIDNTRAEQLRKSLDRLRDTLAGANSHSDARVGVPPVSNDSASLTLQCDVDCRIRIDGGTEESLLAKHNQPYSLAPGTHSLLATGAGHSWKSSIVLQKNSRKSIAIPVGHSAVYTGDDSDRERILQEIAIARARIESNRIKAAEADEQRRKLLAQIEEQIQRQQQRRRRAELLVKQIGTYESLYEKETR